MATTTIIPAGATEVTSSAITIADGTSANLFLIGPGAAAGAGFGSVSLEVQGEDGAWSELWTFDTAAQRTARITGPLVIRGRRRLAGTGTLAVGLGRG